MNELHETNNNPVLNNIPTDYNTDMDESIVDTVIDPVNPVNHNNIDNVNKIDSVNKSADSVNNIPDNNNSDNSLNNNSEYKNKFVPMNLLSAEERRIRQSNGGKKGGVAANKKRQERKTIGDILESMLSRQMNDDDIEEVLGGSAVLLGEDKSAYAVMTAKMICQAMAGDVKAFLAIRDSAGDKPVERTEQVLDVLTDKDKQMIENMKARLSKIG